MAGLPNATFIGFTGTAVDKTAYARGRSRLSGCEDDQGLSAQVFHRREHRGRHHAAALLPACGPTKCWCRTKSWSRSSLRWPRPRHRGHRGIEQNSRARGELEEFPSRASSGCSRWRVTWPTITGRSVEPLGYKAFLVAVDREAWRVLQGGARCHPAPEYSEIVFTGQQQRPETPEKGIGNRSARSRSAKLSSKPASGRRF